MSQEEIVEEHNRHCPHSEALTAADALADAVQFGDNHGHNGLGRIRLDGT